MLSSFCVFRNKGFCWAERVGRGIGGPFGDPQSDGALCQAKAAVKWGSFTMRLLSYGLSDVGRKRPHNEDAWLCDDAMGLYVVADGVGGHAKGEVASQESIEQVQ